MEQGIQIVTIKNFSPLYRDGEEANNIQYVQLEETGFSIVVQKGRFNIGDKALYIQPDWCLSDHELFSDYIAPEGNQNKSKLGKIDKIPRRVRSVKFNFTDSLNNQVYSTGILIALSEIQDYPQDYININNPETNITDYLGVFKYVAPEKTKLGDSLGDLPEGLYKTDETNYYNSLKTLRGLLPCKLIGLCKIDGSSESIYYKNEEKFGICSRGLEKKIYNLEREGYKLIKKSKEINIGDKVCRKYEKFKSGLVVNTVKDFVPSPYKETDTACIFEEDDSIVNLKDLLVPQYKNLITEEFVDYTLIESTVPLVEKIVDDVFVELGLPILEKLKNNKESIVIRGEIFGVGLNGSSNSNNPHNKLDKQFKAFRVDDFSSDKAIKLPIKTSMEICEKLDIPFVDTIFIQEFNTIEEIEQVCLNYFKSNLIEGIVLATYDSNVYSSKFMNPEYDSKK